MNNNLEDDVSALADAFHGLLPPERSQKMKFLAAAGEPVIAYENLCTRLLEFDVTLTTSQLDHIRQIGLTMGSAPKFWERLAALTSQWTFPASPTA